jgi:DNA-directed RNA polymerase specialized sigma24 family protein
MPNHELASTGRLSLTRVLQQDYNFIILADGGFGKRNVYRSNPSSLLCMGEKHFQFEELVLPHLDGAYNFAFWLIQNEGDARAIVEEAYAQARREFKKVGATDPRVWLFKIVLKHAHAWIQRRDNRPKMGSFPNDIPIEGEAFIRRCDREKL